jgi:hypothetical protein
MVDIIHKSWLFVKGESWDVAGMSKADLQICAKI